MGRDAWRAVAPVNSEEASNRPDRNRRSTPIDADVTDAHPRASALIGGLGDAF